MSLSDSESDQLYSRDKIWEDWEGNRNNKKTIIEDTAISI